MAESDSRENRAPVPQVAGRFDSEARRWTAGNIATVIIVALVALLVITVGLVLILQNVFTGNGL